MPTYLFALVTISFDGAIGLLTSAYKEIDLYSFCSIDSGSSIK